MLPADLPEPDVRQAKFLCQMDHRFRPDEIVEFRSFHDVPSAVVLTNPRTHSKKQVRQITNSIREFGFTTPVLVDSSNLIIAGHGRADPCPTGIRL